MDIQHAGGTSRVHVNQQENGGRWNDLGAFAFRGAAVVRILADGSSSTCADAASLEPASSVPENLVIDNGDGGTSFTGTWKASAGTGPHGRTSLHARGGPTYTYTGSATGTYRVYAWWTEYPSRSASVPIAIRHAGGVSNLRVSQRVGGAQWNLLGEWTFDGEAQITITAEGMDSTCADAVRLEPSS